MSEDFVPDCPYDHSHGYGYAKHRRLSRGYFCVVTAACRAKPTVPGASRLAFSSMVGI